MRHAADRRTALDSEAALRATVLATLHPCDSLPGTAVPPLTSSDFDLNPDLLDHPEFQKPLRDAAVLVPIVRRSPLSMLLTLRTEALPNHAGQISFPGGKIEPGDPSPLDAALREAEEEIGLARHHVEPLGYLDCYRTGTGFRIFPLVALVDPDVPLSPDPREVADVFEVPLTFLLDPANLQKMSRVWQGRERHFYAIPYEQRFIWGATAGMIRNLSQRLSTV